MAEIERLQRALRNAHNAGDTAAAQRLAGMIRAQREAAAGQPSTFGDVARSFASGAARGAMELIGLPATIGQIPMQLAQIVGLVPEDQDVRSMLAGSRIREGASELTGGATEYQPETTAGEYARTVGEFLPGLITPGGAATRVIGGVIAPAVGSETAGQAARALGASETGEGIARLAGALSPMALSSIGRRVISPTGGANQARLAYAQTLEYAGVPLTAGQRTGSTTVMAAEDALQPSEQQLESFTKAVMRSIGSNADTASAQALDEAATRIGSVFDDVARGVDATPDVGVLQVFDDIADTYRQLAPTAGRAPIIDNIANAIEQAIRSGNRIPGNTLQTWRSRLSSLTRTGDPATRDAAIRGLNAVDEMINQSLRNAGRADDVARLGQARQQYRDFLAVERAAQQGSSGARMGLLSPQAIEGALMRQSGRQFVRGQRGDIGSLAAAGGAILRPTPSVLPGGVRAIQGAGRAAGAGIGFGAGGPIGAIVGAASPEIVRGLARTRAGQAYLGNQLLGPSVGPRLSAAQRAMLYGPAAMSQGQQR